MLVEARKQWILETKIHETEAIRASVEEAKLAFKTSAEEELALARRKFSEEFEKCRLDTENRVRRELLLSRPLMIEKAISTDQAAKVYFYYRRLHFWLNYCYL
ncbi:unnamed protein product [Protopolystoma xenopodis]|uniref:Uncharacterized protein n=1 Tax=Protopolystoma xenopodis TaxID=117903 RepID=A0A3S5B5C8_9PLAT|nr:unnamed protein product [Protopolystoma xenopodis]